MTATSNTITEGKQKELASALEDFQQAMASIAGPYADGENRLIALAYGKTTKRVTKFSITPDDVEWATEFIADLVQAAEYLASELEQAQERFVEIAERPECKHGEDPDYCDPCYEEEHGSDDD